MRCDAFNENVSEMVSGVWVWVSFKVRLWILNWNSTKKSKMQVYAGKMQTFMKKRKMYKLHVETDSAEWKRMAKKKQWVLVCMLDIICHLWNCSKCARVVLSLQHSAMVEQFNNTSHIKCIFIYVSFWHSLRKTFGFESKREIVCVFFHVWNTVETAIKTKEKPKLPKKVALGELYAKYSLFDAHAGNSFCCKPSFVSSSLRFQGSWVSMAVGVVTRVSPKIRQIQTLLAQEHQNQFNRIWKMAVNWKNNFFVAVEICDSIWKWSDLLKLNFVLRCIKLDANDDVMPSWFSNKRNDRHKANQEFAVLSLSKFVAPLWAQIEAKRKLIKLPKIVMNSSWENESRAKLITLWLKIISLKLRQKNFLSKGGRYSSDFVPMCFNDSLTSYYFLIVFKHSFHTFQITFGYTLLGWRKTNVIPIIIVTCEIYFNAQKFSFTSKK